MATSLSDLPVSANLRLWYDADDASTITHSSGSVSQWDDKSGNSDHATQGTAARKPTYITTGPKPLISFDGGDILIIPGTSIFQVSGGNYPKTIFAVMSATADGMVIGHGSSSSGYQDTYQVGLNVRNSHIRLSAVSGGSGVQFEGTSNPSEELVAVIQMESGDSEIFTLFFGDTVAASEATNSGSLNSYGYSRATIGATDGSASGNIRDPFTGKIREILVYEAKLSDSDRNDTINYLRAKWFDQTVAHQLSISVIVDTEQSIGFSVAVPVGGDVRGQALVFPKDLRHDNLGFRTISFLKGKGDT